MTFCSRVISYRKTPVAQTAAPWQTGLQNGQPLSSPAVSLNLVGGLEPRQFSPVLHGGGKPLVLQMEGVVQNWTNAKLCDVANLILGAILFISPWVFGFDAGRASQNAYIAGIIIAVIAIAALAAFAIWEEWLNLVVGLWTLASPWLLGFQQQAGAMRVHVAIGVAVVILAAIEIWIMSQHPPRLTASR